VLNPTDSVLDLSDSVLNPTDSVLDLSDSVLNPSDSVLDPSDTVLNPSDPSRRPGEASARKVYRYAVLATTPPSSAVNVSSNALARM
jgi:hypothetical protein